VRSLTCQEVLDQLADFMDEAAHAELVGAVERHIGACPHCRIEVDSLRMTIRIFRREERVELPQALAVRLRDALERAYRDGCGGNEGTSEA
jgi:anti-sigma factor RsiW